MKINIPQVIQIMASKQILEDHNIPCFVAPGMIGIVVERPDWVVAGCLPIFIDGAYIII